MTLGWNIQGANSGAIDPPALAPDLLGRLGSLPGDRLGDMLDTWLETIPKPPTVPFTVRPVPSWIPPPHPTLAPTS